MKKAVTIKQIADAINQNLLGMSGHPLIAGVGIEYAWGCLKLKFRRIFKDFVAQHLRRNVMNAFNPNLLNIDLCRRYARKIRDFGRVYKKMAALKLVYANLTEQEAGSN